MKTILVIIPARMRRILKVLLLMVVQVYLSQFGSETSVNADFHKCYPFASRAANLWMYHFRSSEPNGKPISPKLFNATVGIFVGNGYKLWMELIVDDGWSTFTAQHCEENLDSATPLWSACREGLLQIVHHLLLGSPKDLGEQCGSLGYPLHAACAYHGHKDKNNVVKLLLRSGRRT